ncbi:MAG: right-handed parallel beta-helix repeat-containing protein [Candidatus Aminicenantes bacterium]|jgi:parallel beta-helix repeat protein
MRSIKTITICILAFFLWSTPSSFSFVQVNHKTDREKLEALIDSFETKFLIGKHFDGQPNIDFDMDTLAVDDFRPNVIVATLDFEHVPSSQHGTASIAYQWDNMEFNRIHSSYWMWGTEIAGEITANTTWNPAGSPYYLTGYLQVNVGVTLNIEPGTVVRVRKFDYGEIQTEISVFGTMNCQNATFTTSCDFETYDNTQITQTEADWDGIFIRGSGVCTMDDSLIEYAANGLFIETDGDIAISNCTIRRCNDGIEIEDKTGTHLIENNTISDCNESIDCVNMTSALEINGNTIASAAKWNSLTGVLISNASPVISGNTISGFDAGIRCYSSSSDITLNNIQNNFYGFYCGSGASPVIHNNNIEGNTGYGLYNFDSGITIDAENNWWGDASGPYNYTTNPSGLGDNVSDYVDFIPWLTSQVTAILP